MRTLKRPMFRKGGSANEGIMTGLVDRKGYANEGLVNPSAWSKGKNVAKEATKKVAQAAPGWFGKNLGTEAGLMRLFQRMGLGTASRIGGMAMGWPATAAIGTAYAAAPLAKYLKEPTAALETELAEAGAFDPTSPNFAGQFGFTEPPVTKEMLEPVTGIEGPPGGTQLPFYKKPKKDEEGTGGLEDIKIKETIADKRSRLNKRAKEFLDILSPEAQKRALVDSAAAASEALGQSTGDTKQDIANAITAAAKASGGAKDVLDKANLLAIQEDIQKGLKVDKVSETDKQWSKWVIANPREKGESMPDYYARILEKMSTGKIPVETKLDFEKNYVNMGKTIQEGRAAWAKRKFRRHKDFGGIIDKENMPTPVEGKKYYDPEADDWKNHKGEPTTAPGE